MSYLELILDKVKKADLENFKEKVESMEAPHIQRRSDLGISSISDIVHNKEVNIENRELEVSSISMHDSDLTVSANQPTVNSDDADASPEVFDKFLQSIRG